MAKKRKKDVNETAFSVVVQATGVKERKYDVAASYGPFTKTQKDPEPKPPVKKKKKSVSKKKKTATKRRVERKKTHK